MPVTQPDFDDELIRRFGVAVEEIMRSRMVSNFGPWNRRFERAVEQWVGQGVRAIAFPSADVALMALLSVVRGGHRGVALPSLTFNSTANAGLWSGLRPFFLDVNPRTFLLDAPSLINAFDPTRRRALLAVHTFGNPLPMRAEMSRWAETAPVLFDGAHAFGATCGGVPVGAEGTATVFSFSGTKPVTSGEGGVVTTRDRAIASSLQFVRNYGFQDDYVTRQRGLNGKMSELHAALGVLMIEQMEQLLSRRRAVANRYRDLLGGLDVGFQEPTDMAGHTYKDFAILLKDPDGLLRRLASLGIQAKRYYRPLHTMGFYRARRELPQTDRIWERVLCLPIYGHLSDVEQDEVVHAVRAHLRGEG